MVERTTHSPLPNKLGMPSVLVEGSRRSWGRYYIRCYIMGLAVFTSACAHLEPSDDAIIARRFTIDVGNFFATCFPELLVAVPIASLLLSVWRTW